MAGRPRTLRFDIEPYTGAFPVRFGMTRDEVHRLLGPPESSNPVWDGSGISDHYSTARFNIGYDLTGCADHVGLCPGAVGLAIQGQVIWTPQLQPDPNPIFLAIDPHPVEFVGFWTFLQLGVTTTGYHDDDPGQRAVTVFPHGSKDKLLTEATPADTSKYRS